MSAFRQKFVPKVRVEKWFPGHMTRGIRQVQTVLKKVDCVIEVHDARIPFTGRDSEYHRSLSAVRPSVLVLNKMDLFDDRYKECVLEKLSKRHSDIIFANSKTGRNCEKILPRLLKIVRSTDRFNRSDLPDINIMVVGIPNVGKSTVINKLRALYSDKSVINKSPAEVGAQAGVTKHVMQKIKICANPLVYLLDTPGILEPKGVTVEEIMRMALCSTQSDKVIGEETMVDYLLYWLNKRKRFDYVDYLKIDEPTDDIANVLVKTAIGNNFYRRFKSLKGGTGECPDLDKATLHFLNAFRSGKLGKFMLDDEYVQLQERDEVVDSKQNAIEENA